ncbi:hypothetical protein [Oricola sp.]|uniref:hypothetical protein n=1 Tax=Oricola sp. TaxID=1979950 RepID=UPI0025DC1A2E|nr:hypothetical protein [Oricola sp.]MCI5077078.1 hypothetical protein [Oricola sp.]
MRRDILALYDSALEPAIDETGIHLNAEMPLNHLGFIVHYHDLQDGLPTADSLDGVAAVLTAFPRQVSNYRAYFRWLVDVAAPKVPRVIVMGDIGGAPSPLEARRLNAVFSRMGLKLKAGEISNVLEARVVTQDASVIGFERGPDPIPESHPIVEREGDTASVALEYETPQRTRLQRSVVVATGPGGGYAASGFYIHYESGIGMQRWIVDPFTFFARALGEPVFPVPDTTTVSGRRLFFSHVDGDGWNSITRIERYRDKPTTSAEVMLKDLVEPYPDLPVTIGPVLSDIDQSTKRGVAAAEIAGQLFALPQVEVATHTNTHPFEWGFFEDYDRQRELALIKGTPTEESKSVIEQVGDAVASVWRRPRNPFLAMSDALPRAYMNKPFSVETEVGDALSETEKLAPPGKKIAVYLWSGDALPFEAAIAATRKAGVRNLNGGSSRFDAQSPSVSYVSPISRPAGDQRQIYAVNTNENVYTNLWRDRFNGYAQLSETFKRTEDPVRLRGTNVYYHAYSAERTASLNAVKSLLDWAREADVIPIEASRYAAIADGFFSTRIEWLGGRSWKVSDRDGLNTVRFDAADDLAIDLAGSVGVLGTSRHAQSLYVALDAATPEAVVTLKPRGEREAPADAGQVLLAQSRWLVSDMQRDACGFSFETRGYGRGEFEWSDLPAGTYTVRATRDGTELQSAAVTADDEGQLSFALPFNGFEPAAISVRCQAEEGRS